MSQRGLRTGDLDLQGQIGLETYVKTLCKKLM